MSASATALIRAAPKYLGVPYSDLDCQAYVEKCLSEIGIRENLPGSNAWYRHMTWTGTPEECKRSFGKIPPGAFLFILEHDGNEPEKYKPDGIGNASHIGIYTGMTGYEMVQIAKNAGVENAAKYDFGKGAVHSSQSRGFVCTSNFKGNSIRDGWNMIGLWDRLSYDIDIPGEEVKPMTATVYVPKGGTVFLRGKPSQKVPYICRIPSGAKVEMVGEDQNGWTAVNYDGLKGYMMTEFLIPGDVTPGEQEQTGDTIPVQRKWLEETYAYIGSLLGVKG